MSIDIKERFEAYSKSTFLDVHLPRASGFDPATLIRNGTPEDIVNAPTRRNLFFGTDSPKSRRLEPLLNIESVDEQANILVILKTPQPEEAVRDILPGLELVIGAHATDAVPQGTGNAASASGKHDLNSKTFPASSFVDIVALEDRTYVIWRPVLHLSRPRSGLKRPAIYFTANLTIANARQKLPIRNKSEDHLKSFEPLPGNVLEPLQHDPALSNSNVCLSESRITKVAPKPPNLADSVKPIRGASKRAFPAVPALFTRIRYSTLPDALVASLHLETSNLIAGTVQITEASLDIRNAAVENLTNIALPLDTRGGDETILLFKLAPTDQNSPPTEDTPVQISIKAEANLDQGSQIPLDIQWQAHVDFSRTWQKPTYRWSQPLRATSHHKSLSVQSIPKISVDAGSRASDDLSEGGVTFSFTASATTHASEELKLSVHCTNRSSRTRRFGLVMLQPRKPRTTALSSATNLVEADLMAGIFSAPPLERTKPPDVLDLNPDVRIGPLPAGACFETHMTFKALRTGVLDLGTLRIVDLDTRQTVDVRELPDVVALERIDAM